MATKTATKMTLRDAALDHQAVMVNGHEWRVHIGLKSAHLHRQVRVRRPMRCAMWRTVWIDRPLDMTVETVGKWL